MLVSAEQGFCYNVFMISEFSVTIDDKELKDLIKKLSNADEFFDGAVRNIALAASRKLKEETPKDTGTTARAWTAPKKLAKSAYRISNEEMTSDKQHLIVEILNEGRREVLPKNSGGLFIPLTGKGKSRGEGYKKGMKYGIDFVLAQKARAVKGSKFIDKAVETIAGDLENAVAKKIDEL
ncbi:hypothetical protein NO1_2047 [Candidatus Termititenax aidoneus]|uniref:Uncharacterized protein n=1 Tax=Termititenax aidoneus TaxID=2218524 RepID=A0A388TDF0_TERA1|nr:hypothetical protein NO1_2047 [Candidatus Termititenax aidoneus]